MLGSSLGLHFSNTRLKILAFNYTFDLTSSGSTIWERYNSNGNISNQLGQNAPSQSTDDWLAATYGADATNITGLKFDVQDIGFTDGKIGDLGVLSYKLFLEGDWDGEDDISYWRHEIYSAPQGPVANVSLPQDEIINMSVPVSRPIDANTYAKYDNWHSIGLTKRVVLTNGHSAFSSDRPNTGAVFYIKDFNFQVWR